MTKKNIIIAIVIVALAGAGLWYFFSFEGAKIFFQEKRQWLE
jgi:flagellar basal body-associated protein FliL